MENSIEKGSPLPPFLTKCYDMVQDTTTDSIVSWSPTNESFIIWDMTAFSRDLLPKYFKHSNFSSFVRQLNTYGFRKADSDRWEFANEGFIKGQKHLLRNIRRKKHPHGVVQQKPSQQNTSVGACVEVGKFGLQEEVESLKRDKNVLMQELVKLRQHQQTAEEKVHCLRKRLKGMEKAQQQMLSFLAMAMQSPGFLVQLLQQNEPNWHRTETSKKRPHPALEQVTESIEPVGSDGQIVRYQPPRNEAPKPLLMPISNTDASPEMDPSLNGVNDFFMNVDSRSLPMETDFLSSEHNGPFILPEFPDDQILEELLLASPFLENIEQAEPNNLDPMDTGMEVESTLHDTWLKTSQKLDLLTEQMELLASETNNRHEVQ